MLTFPSSTSTWTWRFTLQVCSFTLTHSFFYFQQVQQLIAASPDVLLEDVAFMGKFPLTESPPKNISLEVVVEPQQQNPKRKNDSEKLNHKTECSAENAVAKRTSFSSPKNGSHLANHTPHSLLFYYYLL